MTPYYADDWLTVYLGDCREVMAAMEPESVHCVVTSPPYWGLRDYGTATWIGGELDHEHVGSVMRTAPPGTEKQASNKGASAVTSGDCRCGATRVDSQLGLEPTPEAYVEAMVAVFREVRRVLRKDGTVWLNLGDSYAANWRGGGPESATEKQLSNRGTVDFMGRPPTSGLKPKDLVGIPWRVAFALQADGWYLRSDIIWAKPNPMPESVTDRPTKAHEYVFLLSKSPRYYYDAEAVREEGEGYGRSIRSRGDLFGAVGMDAIHGTGTGTHTFAGGRNLRSVWTIATEPYPGAHFATFPRALVEPCVKAGTSEKGVCPECGAPWVREVERELDHYTGGHKGRGVGDANGMTDMSEMRPAIFRTTTTGWRPSCAHGREPVPATVLDPFAGSGTTGLVAQSLSRRAVLIDLSGEYMKQLMTRNAQSPLGLR